MNFYHMNVNGHGVGWCRCMDHEVGDIRLFVTIVCVSLHCILFYLWIYSSLLVLWRHTDFRCELVGLSAHVGNGDAAQYLFFLSFVIPIYIFLFCRRNTLCHVSLIYFVWEFPKPLKSCNLRLNKSKVR